MPHPSEYDAWIRTGDYRVFRHFYHPGWPEERMFLSNPNQAYITSKNGICPAHGIDRRNAWNGGNIYHFKIVPSSTCPDNSIITQTWTGITSHYPEGHQFKTLRDLFMEHSSGCYQNNTLLEPPPWLVDAT